MCDFILKNKKGYTLTELIFAMAINLLIFSILCGVLVSVLRRNNTQDHVVRNEENSCIAMEKLVKGIRSAGYNPRVIKFSAISSVSDTSLTINQDLNEDGTVETILYKYNSTQKKITKTSNGVNTLIAGNIDALTFIPKDSGGITTYSKSAVKQIQIYLTGRTEFADPGYSLNGGYRTFNISSIVLLRN